MKNTSSYNVLKRFAVPVSDGPLYLILFLTSDCTLKCQHCFNWKSAHPDPLLLSEIEKISRTMQSLGFIILTGGEPFLRDDLPEIAKMFYMNTSARNFAIPTNGTLTAKAESSVESIMKNCPDMKLTVNISIDGIGELHDRIRGVPGTFERAVITYNVLSKLKKKYKNLNIGIITTISTMNQDYIKEIHDYVIRDMKTPIWAPFLIRGNPRNPEIKNVDPDKYKIADTLLKKDIKNKKYSEYSGFLFAKINSAKNVVRREIITKTLKEKRYQDIPCYAGRLNAVIYPEGDVYACELLDKKIGNIKDFNYDMKKLWHSAEADKIREYIKQSKCFCTHECFLTTNILYNLKSYPKILLWWTRFLF